MQSKMWVFPKTYDKAKWGKGPWMNEPDKMQYVHPAGVLPCLVVRNMVGALCGYVGIPESHPFYGFHYDDSALDFHVHGGLTYSDQQGSPREDSPHPEHFVGAEFEDDESPNVWWFGFDCAHSGDLCPKYAEYNIGLSRLTDTYRDFNYVRGEVYKMGEFMMEHMLKPEPVAPEPVLIPPRGRRKVGNV